MPTVKVKMLKQCLPAWKKGVEVVMGKYILDVQALQFYLKFGDGDILYEDLPICIF